MKGLRLRKIVRLVPGLRLNLSKSGISLTMGGKGLALNLGKNGVKATLGAPGTGLSYSSHIAARNPGKSSWPQRIFFLIVVLAILAIAAGRLFS